MASGVFIADGTEGAPGKSIYLISFCNFGLN